MKLFGLEIKRMEKSKMPDTIPVWYDKNPNALVKGDFTSMLKAYKSWVYVCANKNSISFAQQTFKLYVTKTSPDEKLLIKTKAITNEKKKAIIKNAGIQSLSCVQKAYEIEEVSEHPLLDLMRNINPFMNRFEFFEMLNLHQELTGNSFAYIVKNKIGVPSQLWILQPDRMTVVPSKEKWILGYLYKGLDGTEVPFLAEEIIHFKFPNPKDPYYGLSPLAAMADAYNAGVTYSNYEQSLMGNQAIPPIALVAPKDVTYDEATWKRILTRWNKTYGGASNQGKTAWLEGGFTIQPLNVSPKDMGYLMGRKWTREEIAAGYGVPMSKLTSESVNRANAESGDYQYLSDTIAPRCKRFEEKINEQLTPMFDERLFGMFDDPVPENREFLLKERESNLKSMLTTINEEREFLGYEHVEWGEFPVGSMGMAPYKGKEQEQGQEAQPPTGEEKGIEELLNLEEVLSDAIAKEIISKRLKCQKSVR